MAVYRFKIAFEDLADISREIEIKSSQTFEDLHKGIQNAINFDASKPASFYMSNDHWVKDQEISLTQRPSRNGQENVLMKNAALSDWIVDPHQKIYYISDYDASWTFQLELNKIIPAADVNKMYPACVKVNGDAPKQFSATAPLKIAPVITDEINEPIIDDYVEDDSILDEEEITVDAEEADEITSEEPEPGEEPEGNF